MIKTVNVFLITNIKQNQYLDKIPNINKKKSNHDL